MIMTIRIGDRLPDGKLAEATEFDPVAGCPINPKEVGVAQAIQGKRVAIFGVPGAFTPTCSAKHLPGYVQQRGALKARGVDEVWCVAVNDAFVMAAWGRDQKVGGALRMLGDGSAAWAKALGLEVDLAARGMGIRLRRFSMLVEDGVVTRLNIEGPGKFEVSDADTLLRQLG
jgi:peroxiredoxin